MHVRMELYVPPPGVQNTQNTQFSSQVLWPSCHILQGGGALAQQKRVALFLMGAQPLPQTLGNSEGNQIIGNGQELEFLLFDPLDGVALAALRTGAMVVGLIDKVVPAA